MTYARSRLEWIELSKKMSNAWRVASSGVANKRLNIGIKPRQVEHS